VSDATTAPADEAREEMHEPGPEAEPETLFGLPVARSRGQIVLFPNREQLLSIVKTMHDDGYLMCIDVTAVDYLTFGRRTGAEGDVLFTQRTVPGGLEAERFEVVYQLLNHRTGERVRLRVQVPAHDPIVASLPAPALQLLLAGGIVYTLGVPFHLMEWMRFHNAIWHLFVLGGAACQFAAIETAVIQN